MFGNRRHFRELLGRPRRGSPPQHPGRPAQAAGERRSPDTRGRGAGARWAAYSLTEALHPARAGLRAAWRVGLCDTARLRSGCGCAPKCSQRAARRCGPNSWPSCGPSTLGPQRQNGQVPASSNASPRALRRCKLKPSTRHLPARNEHAVAWTSSCARPARPGYGTLTGNLPECEAMPAAQERPVYPPDERFPRSRLGGSRRTRRSYPLAVRARRIRRRSACP